MQSAQQVMRPALWVPPIDMDRFRREGFAVFEGLFSSAECATLIREIDQFIGEGRRIAVELPAHADLVTHPKLMAIADTILGPRFGFHHLHTARHGAGTPTFAWHHDYEQIPQANRSHTMIHCFMYISGLNGTVGDLVAIPGSHLAVLDRYLFSMFQAADLPGTVVFNKVAPGSVIVVHSALLHARRAKPGGEDHPRYFIDAAYCQDGIQWPSYEERGNWHEILRHLRDRDRDKGGNFQWLFDEQHFFEAKDVAKRFHEVNRGSLALKTLGIGK
jgi:hypothetical protein